MDKRVFETEDGVSKGSLTIKDIETDNVSDGFHTFGELYAHRIELFIALCRQFKNIPGKVWRSRFHSDGSHFDGWFVLGINKSKGNQITYHLPDSKWCDTEFAELLVQAPLFDGHSPTDVLERLKRL